MAAKLKILCTKNTGDAFSTLAAERNIVLDQMPFIQTREMVSQENKDLIRKFDAKFIIAIFTSVNAVKAVAKIDCKMAWDVFCIEPVTRKMVQELFPNVTILASAPNAALLANKIIAMRPDRRLVFFSGSKRSDVLPDQLTLHHIPWQEVMVYETIETPVRVTETYNAILFFSPAAVRSFFSVNTITSEVVLFAIGLSTKKELQQHSTNKIFVSPVPETGKLIDMAINHLEKIKTV